jgi:hypothetical protein
LHPERGGAAVATRDRAANSRLRSSALAGRRGRSNRRRVCREASGVRRLRCDARAIRRTHARDLLRADLAKEKQERSRETEALRAETQTLRVRTQALRVRTRDMRARLIRAARSELLFVARQLVVDITKYLGALANAGHAAPRTARGAVNLLAQRWGIDHHVVAEALQFTTPAARRTRSNAERARDMTEAGWQFLPRTDASALMLIWHVREEARATLAHAALRMRRQMRMQHPPQPSRRCRDE